MSESQQGFSPNRVTGIPLENGRFAGNQNEQSETVTMKLYDRGTGTCFNPPLATTAASALAFWQDVEIPDVTIERARTLYAAQQNQDFVDHFQELIDQHMVAWDAQNPEPRFIESKRREWASDRRDEKKSHTQRAVDEERAKFFHSENPQYLGNVTAQQIVRAWFTYRFGVDSGRFPDEAAKLHAHPVELIDGTETIGSLAKRFRLSRFYVQLEKVPDPSVDAIHQMQDALVEILRSVSNNTDRTASNTEPQGL
jgi:hypothetical protein